MSTNPTPLPARDRAQLVATDVHVTRAGRPVLTGLDLVVTPTTRWGLVGENGRGKSTLLEVLAERLPVDAGTVRRVGTIGTARQELASSGARTIGELIDLELAAARRALRDLDRATAALADGRAGATDDYTEALHATEVLDAWDVDRRVDVALEALGAITDRTRPLSTLSVGQRHRVRLAGLLDAGHDFLLLDEPTNHLDADGLRYLTERLRERDGGIVVASHDRALLADVATGIVDLDPTRDGRPLITGAGYEQSREARTAEWHRWNDDYLREQVERRRLTDDLHAARQRLISGWRPDKGTGKHQRATRAPALVRSVHRRRDELDAHALTVPQPPARLQFPDLRDEPGRTLVETVGVGVEDRLTSPVTTLLTAGDRLVVAGPNGAGKSTLLAVLAGALGPTAGWRRAGAGVHVALLEQESRPPAAASARTVYESHVAALSAAGLLGSEGSVAFGSLGLLGSTDANRPLRDLSVGQQRRVDLALVLAGRPHVLLLDEPTNHLSVTLVDDLTAALRATPAAVVVATHDRQLDRDLADWPRLDLAAS